MATKDVIALHRALTNGEGKKLTLQSLTLKTNPLISRLNNTRPHSVSIEDAFFGDSGKGRVTAELNQLLGKKGKLYSLRYNGGANAGHECVINGEVIVMHQLPMALISENAVGIVGRGMVIHPKDFVNELEFIAAKFGGKIPGKLVIDERAVLSLDTHRAYENALNTLTTGGRGSTGRGISPAYASFYERVAVTVKDLMARDWEDRFRAHYRFYEKRIRGFGKEFNLATMEVAFLGGAPGEKKVVGNEDEFIKRLSVTRSTLKKYVSSDVFSLIQTAWNNPKIPFTIEGAQGAGLDPYHGVYPDITASRPMSRAINDSSYNIILPEEISLRVAVMKTTYMSSVGKRVLPNVKDAKQEKWIQEAFDEKGRSTGRLRDIYPISIPIAKYLRRAAGYTHLVATHLDASRESVPIRVVTHYIDKKTGKEAHYLPYQDHLDTLRPHIVEFPGWNGEVFKEGASASIPREALAYLKFLGSAIAPVVIGTTGPNLGSSISWIPA